VCIFPGTVFCNTEQIKEKHQFLIGEEGKVCFFPLSVCAAQCTYLPGTDFCNTEQVKEKHTIS